MKKQNRKFAEFLKIKSFIIFLIVLFLLLLCISFPDKTVGDFKITLSSLFSGLLALNGFMFSARTFIIFKLYETVYSKRDYKIRIDKLRNEGGYSKELLDPLKSLDRSLSSTAILSLLSLILLVFISSLGEKPDIFNHANIFNMSLLVPPVKMFYPVFYKLLSDAVCSVMIVTFIQMCYCVRSLNINFNSIFDVWKKEEEKTEGRK